MQHSRLILAIALLFVAGCGKKHHAPTEIKNASSDASKQGSLLAARKTGDDSIPLYSDETESFLDSDFFDADTEQIPALAFLDGQDLQAVDPIVASNEDLISDADLEASLLKDEQSGTAQESFQTVYFDFNKNTVRPDQDPAVKKDCQLAQAAAAKNQKVVVEGHCDQIGSAPYNMALSQQRAQAIKKEMVKAGVPATSVKTVGYGYERPVVWSTQQDRSELINELAPNRRAEVLIE